MPRSHSKEESDKMDSAMDADFDATITQANETFWKLDAFLSLSYFTDPSKLCRNYALFSYVHKDFDD